MIISILLAVVFFYTGTLFVLGAFIFPYHMIKTSQNLDRKGAIFFHIAVYSILIFNSSFVGEDKILLMIFMGIYGIIELIYFIFNKYELIGTFDKMIITSVLTTLFVAFIYTQNIELFKEYFDLINIFYRDNLNISEQELVLYNKAFIKHMFYMLFSYSFTTTVMAYIAVDRKNMIKWKMSYIYLILYIVTVILTDIFRIENNYLTNLSSSLRLIYIVYGVKVAFYYLKRKIKYGVVSTFIVIVFTNIFPIGTFVIGALRSFDLRLSLEKPKRN